MKLWHRAHSETGRPRQFAHCRGHLPHDVGHVEDEVRAERYGHLHQPVGDGSVERRGTAQLVRPMDGLHFMDNARVNIEVALRPPHIRLEASGGITLANVRAVAETGVDYISIGAITHSAPAVDFSLELSSS